MSKPLDDALQWLNEKIPQWVLKSINLKQLNKSTMKKIFQKADPAERLQLLRDNCERSESMTFSKELTPDDVTNLRTEYTQADIEFTKKADDFKEVSTAFAKEKADHTKSQKAKLGEIKTGQKSVTEEVFILANHEDKYMEYYANTGEMIHSRKMTAEERQTSMKELRKVV